MRSILFYALFLLTAICNAQSVDTLINDSEDGLFREVLISDVDTTVYAEVFPDVVIKPLKLTPQEKEIHDYYNSISKKWSEKNRKNFESMTPVSFLLRQYSYKIEKNPKLISYASEWVKVYNTFQTETAELKKSKRKKYSKVKKKELKSEYEMDEFKELTKLEGRILVKMIERETGKPFYDMIKEMRGKINADYWQNMSKLAKIGSLKDGFLITEYPVMNRTFEKLEISEKIQKTINAK